MRSTGRLVASDLARAATASVGRDEPGARPRSTSAPLRVEERGDGLLQARGGRRRGRSARRRRGRQGRRRLDGDDDARGRRAGDDAGDPDARAAAAVPRPAVLPARRSAPAPPVPVPGARCCRRRSPCSAARSTAPGCSRSCRSCPTGELRRRPTAAPPGRRRPTARPPSRSPRTRSRAGGEHRAQRDGPVEPLGRAGTRSR